nr:MAG TPA: hypothetical protein [Caudoviricetes sp.]
MSETTAAASGAGSWVLLVVLLHLPRADDADLPP